MTSSRPSLTHIFTVGSLLAIRSHLTLNSSCLFLIWNPLPHCERKPSRYLLLLCSCSARPLEYCLCFFLAICFLIPTKTHFVCTAFPDKQNNSFSFPLFLFTHTVCYLQRSLLIFLTPWVSILDLESGIMFYATYSLEALEKYPLYH